MVDVTAGGSIINTSDETTKNSQTQSHEEQPQGEKPGVGNSETPDVVIIDDQIEALEKRLADAMSRVRRHEASLLRVDGKLARTEKQNERLSRTLQAARERIVSMRKEIDKLTTPPSGYATVLNVNEDDTVDIMANGRKMRVGRDIQFDGVALERGSEVVLNPSMSIISVREPQSTGDIASVVEQLADGRILISVRGDDERVVQLGEELTDTKLRAGDSVRLDQSGAVILERLARPEVEHLVLEEVPDVSYEDIGGLTNQIEAITDAVELPFLHAELFVEHELPAPKGILLYGPPGCGKTMIAKAVANSLAQKVRQRKAELGEENAEARSYFYNIKGPELLNKFVGETERQIRLVFQRAREKSAQGWPVIVFFDEMESLFRTRGTGVSSDMESTIVPQLLAEIDGVETLQNVIVIGASNREDLIDPAILRPGRLDVKIKIERPDRDAAEAIFSRYLTTDIPICEIEVEELGGGDPQKAVQAMVENAIHEMYLEEPQNEFLEITYQNGDKEVTYFKDFASGAMIENMVRRAKKLAIKRFLETGEKGIRSQDLVDSVFQEFKEHEDLPNTTNPDDWARISGRKGERIVFIRTLVENDTNQGGKVIEGVSTGQYL